MTRNWSCDTSVAQADATSNARLISGKNSGRPTGKTQPFPSIRRARPLDGSISRWSSRLESGSCKDADVFRGAWRDADPARRSELVGQLHALTERAVAQVGAVIGAFFGKIAPTARQGQSTCAGPGVR